MKTQIQIEGIRKELEEKFPLEKVKKGHVIDFMQVAYIDDLMSQTFDKIKEKVFIKNFNMFDYNSFIEECKNPEEKYFIARMSEMITEKMLNLFLMNPEYFEQCFGSAKWFQALHELYQKEFFSDSVSQYQDRFWYKKIRSGPVEQKSLFASES